MKLTKDEIEYLWFTTANYLQEAGESVVFIEVNGRTTMRFDHDRGTSIEEFIWEYENGIPILEKLESAMSKGDNKDIATKTRKKFEELASVSKPPLFIILNTFDA